MPRFRVALSLLLLLFAAFLPRPVYAALIPRYDLESLCCLSNDVVEATIARHHAAGHPEWEDRFTATVVTSFAGRYKPGDKISSLDLTLYNPDTTGQHCILFITRKEFQFFTQPVKDVAPQVLDMLLVDSHSRVRRYFQIDNPGGLDAEGYEPESSQDQLPLNNPVFQAHFPSLAAERNVIVRKWAAVDRLRPLLTRTPTPSDIPALQALCRERRYPSVPGLQNIVSEIAQDRLASLHAKLK